MHPILLATLASAAGTCDRLATDVEGSWVGDACLASTDIAAFCAERFRSGCPTWDAAVFSEAPWYGSRCAGGGHVSSGLIFPERPGELWFDADGQLVAAEATCTPSGCAPPCCDGHPAHLTRWGAPFTCDPVGGDTAGVADADGGGSPAVEADTGCGCGHAPAASGGWLVALLALGRRARRVAR